MDPSTPVSTAPDDRAWWLGLVVLWLVAAVAAFALAPDSAAPRFDRFVVAHRGAAVDDVFPPFDVQHEAWWSAAPRNLVLWPLAAGSALAFALGQAATAAVLAPVVAHASRRLGAPSVLAWVAGLLAVANPYVLGLASAGPALLAAALALLAVHLHRVQRRGPAVLTLALAAWVDSSLLAVLAGLLLAGAVGSWRAGRVRVWPLKLDVPTTALLAAVVLGAAPLAARFLLGLPSLPPIGRFSPVDPWAAWWVALLALVARTGPMRRGAWAAGLAALLGLLLQHAQHGGAGLAAFGLVATLVGAAAAVGRASLGLPSSTSRRLAAFGLSAIVAAMAWSPVVATPRQGDAADAALPEVLALVPESLRDGVFAVDLTWAQVPWLSEQVGFVGWADTRFATGSAIWAEAVEGSNVTLLELDGTAMNQALQVVYADCVLGATPTHWAIAGRDCTGRSAQLELAFGA